MRTVGLSGESMRLLCGVAPWLSSWLGKRKAACGQKLLWCRYADSSNLPADIQAARSSSFFPITNYAYAMLDCNWWQGRTPHTAHSSRSPRSHLKLPLQALAQNFACHTCVCNCHAPPNTGWTKRRNDDDASKFPLWAQPRVQRTCMFVDMLRTWHNNKMLPATAALPSHASALPSLHHRAPSTMAIVLTWHQRAWLTGWHYRPETEEPQLAWHTLRGLQWKARAALWMRYLNCGTSVDSREKLATWIIHAFHGTFKWQVEGLSAQVFDFQQIVKLKFKILGI